MRALLLFLLPAGMAFAQPQLELKAAPGGAVLKAKDSTDDRVNMDFPEPTDIKDIARAVALWTGRTMIIDRNVNGKIEIHAPNPMTKEEAYQRFLVALGDLGLAAAEHHGIIQLVPERMLTPEYEQRREARVAPKLAGDELVTIDYTEPTEIKNVIRDVAGWSGRRVILDRNVNGKLQILSSHPVPKAVAYEIYLAALDQLGLAEKDRGFVIQVMPVVSTRHVRELRLPLPPADLGGAVSINHPEPTEIRDILAEASAWYGHDLIYGRDVNGKVQILVPGDLTRGDAYEVLVAALDILGLTTVAQGNAVSVIPYRSLPKGS